MNGSELRLRLQHPDSKSSWYEIKIFLLKGLTLIQKKQERVQNCPPPQCQIGWGTILTILISNTAVGNNGDVFLDLLWTVMEMSPNGSQRCSSKRFESLICVSVRYFTAKFAEGQTLENKAAIYNLKMCNDLLLWSSPTLRSTCMYFAWKKFCDLKEFGFFKIILHASNVYH